MSAILLAGDVNVAQNVGFYVIAAGMLFGAFALVSTDNVVHAALWLVVVLGGIAAQYILAASEFVAVSQVLVYIGAVMVLFLFGIMLTRSSIGRDTDTRNAGWGVGIPVALLLFGVLAYVVFDAVDQNSGRSGADRFFGAVDGNIIVEPDAGSIAATTTGISDGYLGPFLVPLIAVSFVLLAAAVGAIVLARKD
jgi:NADH-quinone oxidoreductase subunit J